MHILRCLGSKLCVRFQRCPLKFHTKFCTHTPQNRHLTRCYKYCRLMKSHSYDPLKCVVKLLNHSQTSLPASLKFMNGYVISPTLYIWYNYREPRLLTLYSVAQHMICIHISTAMIQLRFCPPWHVINLCSSYRAMWIVIRFWVTFKMIHVWLHSCQTQSIHLFRN